MKRKNVIISAMALVLSIGLMMFGVYSASVASLNVTGEVTYTVSDARVLVQGKVNGAKDAGVVDYPSVNSENYALSTRVLSSQDAVNSQYLDFTVGGGFDDDNDKLSAWTLGDMNFEESSEGIVPIVVSLKFTNFSPYALTVRIQFAKTKAEATATSLSRTLSQNVSASNKITLLQAGESECCKEITISYKPSSDSANIDNFDIGMTITFQKADTEPEDNSVDAINDNNGVVKMGQTNKAKNEDIEWRCFAYSADGVNFSKYIAGETILTSENAKYCYFVLETHLHSLNEQFLAGTKFDRDDDRVYYHNDLGDKKVLASDYYYSDIRAFINNDLYTKLAISMQSDIYKAIIPRTMADLYTNNKFSNLNNQTYQYKTFSGTSADLPTGADPNEADKFWLLSMYELQEFFGPSTSENTNADRLFQDSTKSYSFWTRSMTPTQSQRAGNITKDGGVTALMVNNLSSARVAFKLQVV